MSTQPRVRIKRSKYFVPVVITGLLLVLSAFGATINMLLAPKPDINGENIASNQNVSSWLNIFAAVQPTPTSTPQLEKQNIYAGGRLIAVETAGIEANNNPRASDLVVWRQASGSWYIKDGSDGTIQTAVFGQTGDIPLPVDFDGDNLADFCVVRPNYPSTGSATWFIQPNGATSFYAVQFGVASDKPVPADYDGDGKADIAVWRYTDKSFYILLTSSNTLLPLTMDQITNGQATDMAVPADYDGDGMADVAVFRPGATANWYIKQSANNYVEQTMAYGTTGDQPAPGDYDGDGKFDITVRRDSTNEWIIKQSSNNQNASLVFPTTTLTLQATDLSVQGDYDSDGRTDAAIWRPSNGVWCIRKSTDSSIRIDQWGQSGDVPVPAPMKR